MKNQLLPVLYIVSAILLGSIGGLVTSPAIPGWYQGLVKPSFNPPNWIFGPVWTLLYGLMGYSFYLISRANNSLKKKVATNIFIGQFLMNSLWSVLFFGLKNPTLAFFEVLVLWVLIVYMIHAFSKVNKLAAYLQMPYLLWVTFASVLNGSIVLLN